MISSDPVYVSHDLQICQRYAAMFNASVALTSQQEETMIFSK